LAVLGLPTVGHCTRYKWPQLSKQVTHDICSRRLRDCRDVTTAADGIYHRPQTCFQLRRERLRWHITGVTLRPVIVYIYSCVFLLYRCYIATNVHYLAVVAMVPPPLLPSHNPG